MSEEVKAKQTRAKRVDIKIAYGDHDKLQRYANSINSSPTKIVNTLVKQYLDSEEVKKVFEEDGELIQLKKELKKAEREAEKAQKVAEEKQRKVADIKAKIKARKDSKKQN